MTSARRSAHLADFGLARDLDARSRLTRTGAMVGTPAYMSPEQARGEAALAPAGDVWALGCVLYECLEGRRAFDGDGPADVLAGVLTREPPDIAVSRPELPAGLRRLLRAALTKPARRRPPDAAALRDDLDRVAAGRRPRHGPPRSPRAAWVAAGVVIAAAVALAAGGWPRGPAGTPPAVDAESLMANARRIRHADPAAAAAGMAAALARASHRQDWRIEFGRACWAAGRPAEARAAWGAVPPAHATAPEAALWLAVEAFVRHDDEALRLALPAAGAGPDGVARVADGLRAAFRRDWAGARERLREATGAPAALVRGYVEVAADDGDASAALRDFDVAIADGLSAPWVLHHRGRARWVLGDGPGALADYGRAIRAAPDDPEFRLSRATAHWMRDDADAAEADYAAVVALQPDDGRGHLGLGLVRHDRGDRSGALDAFDRAIALAPALGAAWRHRGVTRQAMGDLAGAREDFDQALALDPDDTAAWRERGTCRYDLGDLAGAIADLSEAIRRDPDDASSLANRSAMRFERGDLDGAVADADAALAVAPDLTVALLNRGAVRLQQGDATRALADFDTVTRTTPGLPEGWLNRGLARQTRGDTAGAAADYARALEVAPAGWPRRAAAEQLLAGVRAAPR